MATPSNSLLVALGDYGSDRESSDSEHSEVHLSTNSLQNIKKENIDTADTVTEDRFEDGTPNTDKDAPLDENVDNKFNSEQAYSNVSDEQLEAYRKTKHGLERLLGCGQIPDFLSRPELGECSSELQDKFSHWHVLKHQGANFNDALMRNKTFRNPNIYKRLVDHLDLEETGSNMPPDGFDSATLRNDFNVKDLASDQERRAREYAARKTAEAAANGIRKIQFQSAGHQITQTAATVQAQNGKSFEDAVQRARLIAQHLTKSKK
ncbi:hypothetical protein IWW48_004943 [Coemansia sp. RSA 1200]|nr:hypothetical protein IWW48_004943 [Coemansia sp. RSA 1200]